MAELPQEPIQTETPIQGEEPPMNEDMSMSQNPQDILSQIDDTELAAAIMDDLKADIRDREAFGWVTMRQYDQLAYDGYKEKNKKDMPWNNAANFAVCMTPTLLDTGHANTVGSIFADRDKVVSTKGVGAEDIRTADKVEALMNWQVLNDIEGAYDTVDKTVHVSYKHGNGVIKVMQRDKVVWSRVSIENIFLPVDARGAQPSQTDHIYELIPLTKNDIEQRKSLKMPDGTPVYQGLDDLKPGNRIMMGSAWDAMVNVKDVTSGTSLGERYSRDMYYILECYKTYYFTPKDSKESVKVELIVSMSPQGGKILRKALNNDYDDDTKEYVRPYSMKWIPYPREDRIYGDSLPWIVKQTQEEMDYSHNQAHNAMEKLLKHPTFYDPVSGIDPETMQLTPNSWFPIPNPRNNVYIPDYRFDGLLTYAQTVKADYWELAQRRTGFTELFQGRTPDRAQTLGEAQLRTNKTEIRFKTLYERFEQGFAELLTLTYFYDKKYMPRDTKIKVMGVADYQTIEELFPKGMGGRYNFRFSSAPITEKMQKRDEVKQFYDDAMLNPLVANNPANLWNMLKMRADSLDIRNLEVYIRKPSEAYVLSATESIQRIMSGELNLIPDPKIDAPEYIMRINLFMKTDTFKAADPETQSAIVNLLKIAQNYNFAQKLAIHDAQVLREKAQMAGMQGAMGSDMGASMAGGMGNTQPPLPPEGGQPQ